MPYASKEKQEEYFRRYRKKNKEKIKEYREKYKEKYPERKKESDKKAHAKRKEQDKITSKRKYRNNVERYKQKSREYRETHPWSNFFYNAHQRCINKEHQTYPYYGGKGIEFHLTMDEVETLWHRDGAAKMDRPSIDRKDSNEDYIFGNCRFIELVENIGRK